MNNELKRTIRNYQLDIRPVDRDVLIEDLIAEVEDLEKELDREEERREYLVNDLSDMKEEKDKFERELEEANNTIIELEEKIKYLKQL